MEKAIREFLSSVLKTHEEHQGCYCWSGISPAYNRRAHEMKHSRKMDFEYQGVNYCIAQAVCCSCNNTYYRLSVQLNEVAKDVRAVKKLSALLNA